MPRRPCIRHPAFSCIRHSISLPLERRFRRQLLIARVDFVRSAVYKGRDVTILALDTSTHGGSVALRRAGALVGEHLGSADVPHARRLPGEILDLLRVCSVPLADVSLYAVASGPGAFTGLRIGIATIQGLAFAHGRPVVGISALEGIAHAVHAQAEAAGVPLVAAWMDAARGEVFTSLFDMGPDGRLACVDSPAVASPEATLARWSGIVRGRRILFAGGGAVRYHASTAAALGDRGLLVPHVPVLAGVIAELAEDAAGRGLAAPPHVLRPLYVRRPDAELARDRARAAPSPEP
jgi:tRNA threonylcarbamoyladenosine biosynthesis protein TsaB